MPSRFQANRRRSSCATSDQDASRHRVGPARAQCCQGRLRRPEHGHALDEVARAVPDAGAHHPQARGRVAAGGPDELRRGALEPEDEHALGEPPAPPPTPQPLPGGQVDGDHEGHRGRRPQHCEALERWAGRVARGARESDRGGAGDGEAPELLPTGTDEPVLVRAAEGEHQDEGGGGGAERERAGAPVGTNSGQEHRHGDGDEVGGDDQAGVAGQPPRPVHPGTARLARTQRRGALPPPQQLLAVPVAHVGRVQGGCEPRAGERQHVARRTGRAVADLVHPPLPSLSSGVRRPAPGHVPQRSLRRAAPQSTGPARGAPQRRRTDSSSTPRASACRATSAELAPRGKARPAGPPPGRPGRPGMVRGELRSRR